MFHFSIANLNVLRRVIHRCKGIFRMVALGLILAYPSLNHFSFLLIKYKEKATSINEYFTPYACSRHPINILSAR